jgi:hypothetical protein
MTCLTACLLPSPLKWLAARGGNELVCHHYRQAAALSFLLLAIILSSVPTFLLLHVVALWEDFFYRFRLEEVYSWSYLGLLAVWAGAWAAGLIFAALGSKRPLPLLSSLGRRVWVRSTAGAGWTVLTIAVGSVATLAILSTGVPATGGSKPAEVYLLYDAEIAPRWMATLGGYRLTHAAIARWGQGAAAVAPITQESLHEALAYGRLVFLATHGLSGRILTCGEQLGPRELTSQAPPGKNLRFVYLTACHGGDAGLEWREALAPARVVSFDRNSAALEHAFWLWFRAPGVVAGLE